MGNYSEYSPVIMRVILGLLFVIPGAGKFMGLITEGTHMIAGVLWNSVALVWLLAIVEVLCGIAVLIGYKTRYAVWPLTIVLLGAIFTVHLDLTNPMWVINVLFHVLGIAALAHIGLTGPGPMAADT